MLQTEKAVGKENPEGGHYDADANGVLFNYGFPLGEVSVYSVKSSLERIQRVKKVKDVD